MPQNQGLEIIEKAKQGFKGGVARAKKEVATRSHKFSGHALTTGHPWLKIGANGFSFVVTFSGDGNLFEVNVFAPADQHTGTWEINEKGQLILKVREYQLIVDPIEGPWGEFSGTEYPDGTPFKVRPL